MPAGVQRGLVAEIIKRFEQKGFKLVGERGLVESGCLRSHARNGVMSLP